MDMDLVARVLANAFAAISGFHIASLERRVQSFSSGSDLMMCDCCEIRSLNAFSCCLGKFLPWMSLGRYFMKKLFCSLHDQFEMINNVLSIWSVGSCGGRGRDLISWWLQSWHALRQQVSVLGRLSSFEMQAVLLRRSFDFAAWFLLEERERERERERGFFFGKL